MTWCGNHQHGPISRREALRETSAGFGALALHGLLGQWAMADQRPPLTGQGVSPLSPRLAGFSPRAKRVIFLFMHGGPSQVDTFDHKPALRRDHGKPYPGQKPRVQFAQTGNLMESPYRFAQHGESGQWVSEIFPEVAQMVDELCLVKSLHGSNPAHGAALMVARRELRASEGPPRC